MKKRFNIPFPQANDLERIFKIIFDIGPDGISKFYVVKKYGLADRQGAYYLDALYFLGLVEKINVKYFITAKGMEVLTAGSDNARRMLCLKILEHEFLATLYFETKTISGKDDILDYMAKSISESYGLCYNTAHRRSEAISSWFLWIKDNLNEH